MEKLGYGPDKRLAVTLSSRNIPAYRDPAVILIDQVREIYIDAVLEPVETANWFPKIYRKDYTIAINGTESSVDDPDQQFYENFVCGAVRNSTKTRYRQWLTHKLASWIDQFGTSGCVGCGRCRRASKNSTSKSANRARDSSGMSL